MAREKISLREKLLESGAERLADILISLYEGNFGLKKHLDLVFAGLDQDPREAVRVLKRSIAGLKRSTKFVSYYEARTFGDELNQIREQIKDLLLPNAPEEAMELMLRFLDLSTSVFHRVDDSSGCIAPIFQNASEDLSLISKEINLSPEEAVDLVYSRHMDNPFGIYDYLITDFKEVLGEKGLNLLEARFKKALGQGKETAVQLGLEQIADCKGSVEAYIEAVSLVRRLTPFDELEIIKRLILYKRPKEALQRLQEMPSLSGPFLSEQRRMKIQALILNGDMQIAQEERVEWFRDTLDSSVYADIIENADHDFIAKFRKEALECAHKHSSCLGALSFLTTHALPEELAQYVYSNHPKIDGSCYEFVRPAAKALAEEEPLAATILYRALLEAVLEKAQSKYYPYAARDLVHCEALSVKVLDWQEFPNHASYIEELQAEHKRKVRFWSDVAQAKSRKSNPTRKKVQRSADYYR